MKITRYILLFSLLSIVNSAFAQNKKNFKVFNSILYQGVPDLRRYGIEKLEIIYEDELLAFHKSYRNDGNRKVVDTAKFISASKKAKKASNALVCLDIESWKLNSPDLRKVSQPKYEKAIAYFRSLTPGVSVDYFYHHISPSKVIFPSFYTRNNDRKAWEKETINRLTNLRKLFPDKKIYAFLWPQYNPEKDTGLSFSFLPADYWRFQLETVYKHADGIVIWTHYKDENERKVVFSTRMPWFLQTQKFMKAHNIKLQ